MRGLIVALAVFQLPIAGITKELSDMLARVMVEPIKVEAPAWNPTQEAIDEHFAIYKEMYGQTKKIPEEDIELLASLIHAEVGSIDEEAMRLCGTVVLNRVASDLFPDTLEEVVYQRGQYQCTWNGHIEKGYTDESYEIAKDLLENGTGDVPESVVFQAEFIQGDGIYKKVGRTYFCYID